MSTTGSRFAGLTCRACCTDLPGDRPTGTCPTCGGALFARYDLGALDGRRWSDSLRDRPATLWRYRELLPVLDDGYVITLGEGVTPIVELGTLEVAPGIRVLVKDDGHLPTGAFKARGMAVAVSRAVELGLRSLFVPSAGNAGVALSAYGARAGCQVRVYVPERCGPAFVAACRGYGADVVRLPGTLREVGAAARTAEQGRGSFDLSTLREPYRAEGKKTMGLEIYEQTAVAGLPDAIVYPTGGGTGLVGMALAFDALRSLGLIERAPRLYAVQPEGCAPVVRALREGTTSVAPWDDPRTLAPGLLVPAPFAGERILEAVRSTRGGGATVADREIVRAMEHLARDHGLSASPEAAAPFAALPELARTGAIRPGETVLLYHTGTGLPFDLEALRSSLAGGAG